MVEPPTTLVGERVMAESGTAVAVKEKPRVSDHALSPPILWAFTRHEYVAAPSGPGSMLRPVTVIDATRAFVMSVNSAT
jgi:hypothetical protein